MCLDRLIILMNYFSIVDIFQSATVFFLLRNLSKNANLEIRQSHVAKNVLLFIITDSILFRAFYRKNVVVDKRKKINVNIKKRE